MTDRKKIQAIIICLNVVYLMLLFYKLYIYIYLDTWDGVQPVRRLSIHKEDKLSSQEIIVQFIKLQCY